MFSSITHEGASATVEALSAGASDYVTKPVGANKTEEAIGAIRQELFPKIRALCPPSGEDPAPESSGTPASPRVARRTRASARPRAVALGASTGGPNALARILTPIPPDFPVPILVVQHMPPLFTRFLAERLNTVCGLSVTEAEDGMSLEPGRVVVAPGDFHMVVAREGVDVSLRLNQAPTVNSCRPSVDVLLESAAWVFGSRVLSVILTGMGKDGLDGSIAVRGARGLTIAQDRESSVVWGMPGAVVGSGLADKVLPLDKISSALVRTGLRNPA